MTSPISDSADFHESKALRGPRLVGVIMVLAFGNFFATLDTTVANVLLPHISGALAVSASDGTWVITAYSIAEAVMVPLTGWLAERFGEVRVFIFGIFGFAVFSLFCGTATSLSALITYRILQGICGGPLMPLSQALLFRIIPKRYAGMAMAAWAMTTVLGPITGPVLGGVLGDSWGWQWAFYIKVPFALLLTFMAWKFLMPFARPTKKVPVDKIGLMLLILWVGALQILLGTGQDHDWFHSNFMIFLAVISCLSFIAFLIWELTENTPIVNLAIFSNRSFSVSLIVVALAYGAVAAAIVLVPLWLQTAMHYTATWAGYISAFGGVLAIVAAPLATFLIARIDQRMVITIGLVIGAASALMRIFFNDQMTFWQLAIPQLVQSLCLPMVMLPLMTMSVGTLEKKQVAAGSGQFNFVRALSMAFSTAIVTAVWNNAIIEKRAALVDALGHHSLPAQFILRGAGHSTSLHLYDQMVQAQSVMLGTNQTFLLIGIVMLLTIGAVWLAPKQSSNQT